MNLDISLCADKYCPKKQNCIRWHRPYGVNEYQYYVDFERKDDNCRYFLGRSIYDNRTNTNSFRTCKDNRI